MYFNVVVFLKAQFEFVSFSLTGLLNESKSCLLSADEGGHEREHI